MNFSTSAAHLISSEQNGCCDVSKVYTIYFIGHILSRYISSLPGFPFVTLLPFVTIRTTDKSVKVCDVTCVYHSPAMNPFDRSTQDLVRRFRRSMFISCLHCCTYNGWPASPLKSAGRFLYEMECDECSGGFLTGLRTNLHKPSSVCYWWHVTIPA